MLLAGSYFKKTWNGGNRLAPPAPKPPLTFHYYRYIVARHDKKGRYYEVVKFRKLKDRPGRKPKRAKLVEPHGYDMSLTEFYDPVISYSIRAGNDGYPYKGTVRGTYGGFTHDNTWTANDDLKLIEKLREKMNGSDFDASVFLGTAHQSLRTIADGAIKIAKALQSLRKGNIFKAAQDLLGPAHQHRGRKSFKANTAANMSSAWLELQYGWKPIVQDTFDLAHTVANHLNVPFSTKYQVRKTNLRPMKPVNPGYIAAPVTGYSRMSGQIIAYVKEEPSYTTVLGLKDPSTLIWELLPWSFVVDWFIPIGDYLSARSFAANLKGTFVVTRLDRSYVSGALKGAQTTGTPMKEESVGYYARDIQMKRTVLTTLNVPMPAMKPLVKVASVAHVLNALALLTQVSLKGARSFR